MSAQSTRAVFRLPRSTYLVVLFLAFGVTPLVQHPALVVVYLIPMLAIVFIRRTATVVDAAGITVGALVGSRSLPWGEVRGLSVSGRNVYAVLDDGAVRLPCVRIADLHAVAAASADHLPEVAAPTPKYAPHGRRRR